MVCCRRLPQFVPRRAKKVLDDAMIRRPTLHAVEPDNSLLPTEVTTVRILASVYIASVSTCMWKCIVSRPVCQLLVQQYNNT